MIKGSGKGWHLARRCNVKVDDPGHNYLLQNYHPQGHADLIRPVQPLVFFKKVGDKFPGNEPPEYIGTNCQEVLRALIDRCLYLQSQIPCVETKLIIGHLRNSLRLFEDRALRVKDLGIFSPHSLGGIEEIPACKVCGHIYPHSHVGDHNGRRC